MSNLRTIPVVSNADPLQPVLQQSKVTITESEENEVETWQAYHARMQAMRHRLKGKKGWPKFDRIFMISALSRDGLSELQVSKPLFLFLFSKELLKVQYHFQKSYYGLYHNQWLKNCKSLPAHSGGKGLRIYWLYPLQRYKSKVKLVTIVEGDQKAPFSIATTPRCRGGRYFFPRIAPLYLDIYLILLSVKQGGIKYHF